MTRLAAALAVLALALPAAASAATWTAPELVAGNMVVPTCCPGFGFSNAGNALATFTTQSTEPHTSGAFSGTRYVRRNAAGDWHSRALQPGNPRAFRPVEQQVTAGGRVLVFGALVRYRPYRDHPTGLAVRHGRLTSIGLKVDSTEVLRTTATRWFDFAANASGDAAVAWSVMKGRHRGVFVRRATGAGAFGRVERLAERSPAPASLMVAVGPNGHAIVTWSRGTRVYARVAARGGEFGERYGVGHEGASGALAAGPRGEILMVRVRPPIEKAKLVATFTGSNGSPSKVHVLAGPDPNLYRVRPLVEFDRAARGLVAWTDESAHVATLTGGDPRIEPIQPGGLVRDMAVGPAGGVALAVAGPDDALYVARRGGAGAFAPAEQAAPPGAFIGDASVAFDPLTAEPTVLHLRSVGQDEPVYDAYVVERSGG